MKTLNTLVLMTVLGLASTIPAIAQTPAPINPTPAPKAATSARELSNDDLIQMLETMGYEVRVVESEDKQTKWLYVKVTRNELGGTFEVSLALSPNKKKIWSHLALADLKPEHMENAVAIAKLLELNASEGPNHFRLDASSKMLYLSRCTDNRLLTPALLREHMDALIDAAIRTKDHWNTTKWTASASVQK